MPKLQDEPAETVENKVKTGPLEFKGDWAGLFIRGEKVEDYAIALDMLLSEKNPDDQLILNDLLKLLQSVGNGSFASATQLRSFEECTSTKTGWQKLRERLHPRRQDKLLKIKKTPPPKFNKGDRVWWDRGYDPPCGIVTDRRFVEARESWQYRVRLGNGYYSLFEGELSDTEPY